MKSYLIVTMLYWHIVPATIVALAFARMRHSIVASIVVSPVSTVSFAMFAVYAGHRFPDGANYVNCIFGVLCGMVISFTAGGYIASICSRISAMDGDTASHPTIFVIMSAMRLPVIMCLLGIPATYLLCPATQTHDNIAARSQLLFLFVCNVCLSPLVGCIVMRAVGPKCSPKSTGKGHR
jgi:hypothetical protein